MCFRWISDQKIILNPWPCISIRIKLTSNYWSHAMASKEQRCNKKIWLLTIFGRAISSNFRRHFISKFTENRTYWQLNRYLVVSEAHMQPLSHFGPVGRDNSVLSTHTKWSGLKKVPVTLKTNLCDIEEYTVYLQKWKLNSMKCFSRVKVPVRVLLADGRNFRTMLSVPLKGRLILCWSMISRHLLEGSTIWKLQVLRWRQDSSVFRFHSCEVDQLLKLGAEFFSHLLQNESEWACALT